MFDQRKPGGTKNTKSLRHQGKRSSGRIVTIDLTAEEDAELHRLAYELNIYGKANVLRLGAKLVRKYAARKARSNSEPT